MFSSLRLEFTLVICAPLLSLLLFVCSADAGQTLDTIKKRGFLRCGVSEGTAGFSIPDASGRWTGLEADFCRAVAAAVFGDGEKAAFVPLKASERFPALKAGAVDMLLRQTTWTFDREAGLKVNFPGVLYYDGQGFLVPAQSRVVDLSGLQQKTICMTKGTTHVSHIAAYFGERRWQYRPLINDSAIETARAFYTGQCDAVTSDASELAALKKNAPAGAAHYRILPEQISKEPLGPAVRQGDDEWTSIVRWVLFVLIAAEENGITRDNVRSKIGKDRGTAISGAVMDTHQTARMLGMQPDWAIKVISTTGNYGELFERTVGKQGALGLDRGVNRTWKNGGLLYAPPLR